MSKVRNNKRAECKREPREKIGEAEEARAMKSF